MTEELLQQILAKLDTMATKNDIAELKTELKGDIAKLDARIDALDAKVAELDRKMDALEEQQQQDVVAMLQRMNTKLDAKTDEYDEMLKVLSARSIKHEAEISALKRAKSA